MDWSLCRKKAKGQTYRFLRPELGFKDHVPFYYFAIVSNCILRFAWVSRYSQRTDSKLTQATGHLSSERFVAPFGSSTRIRRCAS